PEVFGAVENGADLLAQLGVVPHLFLPRPDEVLTQIGDIYRDGYAGASLSEHVFASLFRNVFAALISDSAVIPIGLLM
ncbi:hypothetical protein AB9E03_34360, partial [Rhizobium leguminosarum]